MKKGFLILVAVFSYGGVFDYLDALKKMPEFKMDNLGIKEAKVNKKSVVSELYPKVNLYSNATHYSLPVSLRPIIPGQSEVAFSQNVEKIGVNFSLPLFVKEIYDNKRKVEALLKASKYKAKLNFLQREALLIGEISNFDYLLELKNSLKTKKESIKKTIDAIKEGVRVGRVAEFKLIRLKDELLNIDMEIKKVDNLIATSKANIYKLTKLKPTNKILVTATLPKGGEFFALKPIKSEIKAMKYEVKATKDKLLPKLFLRADGYRAFGGGDAENFGSVGVYLTWEVFNKKNVASIQKAKINYLKSKLSFDKNLKDLIAKRDEILKRIKNLNASIKMAKKSLKIKKELLKSARVAFELNEMSVDEYLGYENELAKAKAALASLIAKKNMLIAQLAFMYGENFKKVFK